MNTKWTIGSAFLLIAVVLTAFVFNQDRENPTSDTLEVNIDTHGDSPAAAQGPAKLDPRDYPASRVGTPRVTTAKLKSLSWDNPSDSQWSTGATIYQIWVRSFMDSDGDGNGDLRGIISKLDYLEELGVDALWLSPIQPSPSYHGYDTTDYYGIHPDFGTAADFDELIDEAHDRDIKIVMDLSINHISDQHPWFQKAIEDDTTFKDYFVWKDTMPEKDGIAWTEEIDPSAVWHYKEGVAGFYYGAFGFASPDLNYKNPKVQSEILRVAEYWIDKGVNGFRLDAARYLVENTSAGRRADSKATLAFWRTFTSRVKAKNDDFMLVGEAFADLSVAGIYYEDGNLFDAAFDFNFSPMVRGLVQESPILDTMDTQQLNQGMRNAIWQSLLDRANNHDAPAHFFHSFLNNHDINRISSYLPAQTIRKKIAASLLLTQPGTLYLYYGEETGMEQAGRTDDMYKRGIMQWDNSNTAGFNESGNRWLDDSNFFPWLSDFTPWWSAYWQDARSNNQDVQSQLTEKESLLNFYKTLLDIRKTYRVLTRPKSIELHEGREPIWAARYSNDEQSVWVILNLDAKRKTSVSSQGYLDGDWINLVSDRSIIIDKRFDLDPGELLILGQK